MKKEFWQAASFAHAAPPALDTPLPFLHWKENPSSWCFFQKKKKQKEYKERLLITTTMTSHDK